jgi:5-methylcytosine-specific restriction endonuclease McrA
MAIRVIEAKRAFSLLFRQLAEVVAFEEGSYYNYNFENWCEVSRLKRSFEPDMHDWVSTVNFYIAVPKIIRLLFYDRLPRNEVKFNRRNLFARDRNSCQYCGKKFPTSELSLDHVIPRSLGGKSTWDNIVCACTDCNVRKGGRLPKQAGMSLIKPPVNQNETPSSTSISALNDIAAGSSSSTTPTGPSNSNNKPLLLCSCAPSC